MELNGIGLLWRGGDKFSSGTAARRDKTHRKCTGRKEQQWKGIAKRRKRSLGTAGDGTERKRVGRVWTEKAMEMDGTERKRVGEETKGMASEVNGKARYCEGCEYSRSHNRENVFCRLFGIMINGKHEGCKYHRTGVRANGTTGNTESEEGLDA